MPMKISRDKSRRKALSGKNRSKRPFVLPGEITGQRPGDFPAEAVDNQNNLIFANQEIWISGKEDRWDEARNDDRIDLIPEKKHLEPATWPGFRSRCLSGGP